MLCDEGASSPSRVSSGSTVSRQPRCFRRVATLSVISSRLGSFGFSWNPLSAWRSSSSRSRSASGCTLASWLCHITTGLMCIHRPRENLPRPLRFRPLPAVPPKNFRGLLPVVLHMSKEPLLSQATVLSTTTTTAMLSVLK